MKIKLSYYFVKREINGVLSDVRIVHMQFRREIRGIRRDVKKEETNQRKKRSDKIF